MGKTKFCHDCEKDTDHLLTTYRDKRGTLTCPVCGRVTPFWNFGPLNNDERQYLARKLLSLFGTGASCFHYGQILYKVLGLDKPLTPSEITDFVVKSKREDEL